MPYWAGPVLPTEVGYCQDGVPVVAASPTTNLYRKFRANPRQPRDSIGTASSVAPPFSSIDLILLRLCLVRLSRAPLSTFVDLYIHSSFILNNFVAFLQHLCARPFDSDSPACFQTVHLGGCYIRFRLPARGAQFLDPERPDFSQPCQPQKTDNIDCCSHRGGMK